MKRAQYLYLHTDCQYIVEIIFKLFVLSFLSYHDPSTIYLSGILTPCEPTGRLQSLSITFTFSRYMAKKQRLQSICYQSL